MTGTILEARAIITAEDHTAAAFASVEERIAEVGKQASAINAVSQRVSAVSGNVARTGAAIERRGAQIAAAGGAGLGFGGSLGGIAATIGAGVAAHAGAKAAAERLHERVRMEASGMTAAEIADAQAAAAKLAAEFPAIPQTEFMHMLRNARSIVGNYQEAAEIMEPLAKLRVIAQGARPGADVSEDFDQLVKGLEIKGVTQDPKQFRDYMEGIAKGLNVFGDTLKPYQYYEMFKYGRQATPMLSEKFILGTAPTLAQELGGSSYGRAVSAFNRAIVDNVMKTQAITDFVKLGLVDKGDVKELKSGQYQFLPGAHVHGWRLAQSDPNEWVKQYLLPALQSAGITDREGMAARIGAMFQNQMATQMVLLLATQQSRIDKDLALLSGARGLSAAHDYMMSDPHVALQGLTNAVTSLAGVLGEGTLKALTGPMADLATAISGYTQRLSDAFAKEKEHPESTEPALQGKANRILNRVFGLGDSDASYSAARREQLYGYGLRTDYAKRVGELGLAIGNPADIEADRKKLAAMPSALFAGPDGPSAAAERDRLQASIAAREQAQKELSDIEAADAARSSAAAALASNRSAAMFPLGAPHAHVDPRVAGSGAFSPELGYAGYDARTGMPSTDRITAALSQVKAVVEQPIPVNVAGEANFDATIHVEAAPELLRVVDNVKRLSATAPLSATGHSPSSLGVSMPASQPGSNR